MRTHLMLVAALATLTACPSRPDPLTVSLALEVELGDGTLAAPAVACALVPRARIGEIEVECVEGRIETLLVDELGGAEIRAIRPSGALEGAPVTSSDVALRVVTEATRCTGGLDEDGDSLVDCLDADDCGADPLCRLCGDGLVIAGEQCDDGNTTSGDGCSAACAREELCSGANDDDGDGLVDCNDGDCAGRPPCAQGGAPEACSGGLDEDGDSFVDCLDPDCDGACRPGTGAASLDPGALVGDERLALVRVSLAGYLVVGTPFRPFFAVLGALGWKGDLRRDFTGVRFTAAAPHATLSGYTWVGGTVTGGDPFVALLDGQARIVTGQTWPAAMPGEQVTALVPYGASVTFYSRVATSIRLGSVTPTSGEVSGATTYGFTELAYHDVAAGNLPVLAGSLRRGVASEGIGGVWGASIYGLDGTAVELLGVDAEPDNRWVAVGRAGTDLLVVRGEPDGTLTWQKRLRGPAGASLTGRRVRLAHGATGKPGRVHVIGTWDPGPNAPSDMVLVTMDFATGALIEARAFGTAAASETGLDLELGPALGGDVPSALLGTSSGEVWLVGLPAFGQPTDCAADRGAVTDALVVEDAALVRSEFDPSPLGSTPTSALSFSGTAGTTTMPTDRCVGP